MNFEPVLTPAGFRQLPEDWTSSAQFFAANDGTPIYVATHRKASVKNVLIVIHGQGEHGGRYLHLPFYLQESIDAMICIDLRGHGRSGGVRGHVMQFDEYIDDCYKVIGEWLEQFEKEFGTPVLHLLAHSMGGLVALRLLHMYHDLPFATASVHAPLLGVKVKVPRWKSLPAEILSKYVPHITLPSGLDASLVSHDTNAVAAYKKDPLVHDKVSFRWFTELQIAMSETLSWHNGFVVPLQIMVPLADAIVDSNLSVEFCRELNIEKKNLVTFEGFYHESFNEKEKERAIAEVKNWIDNNSAR